MRGRPWPCGSSWCTTASARSRPGNARSSCACEVSILAVHLRPAPADSLNTPAEGFDMRDISHAERTTVVAAYACRAVLAVLAVLAVWTRIAAQEPAVRMIAEEGEAAQQWARWRGPSGQGLAAGSGYPDTWSGSDNVLWKTPVPGSGNSSPIVWHDRVFLTVSREAGRRLSVVAFRRDTGASLWETAVPDGPVDSPHPKNGFASATPVTDGSRVYVSFG